MKKKKKKKMTKQEFIEAVYDIVLEQYIIPKFINDKHKTHKQYLFEDILILLNTIVKYTPYNAEWASEVISTIEVGGEDNDTEKKNNQS